MKKTRIAIIGNGMICNAAHIPAIKSLIEKGYPVELVACADIRESAARETAERHGIPHWYVDPQQMLDEIRPDFVAVCTPNCYHKQWSIAAMRAGADVACEKPMAVSLADAEELWQVAKETGRRLFPCQCMRWRNYMQQTKKLVEAGELGDIYFSDMEFIRRYGIPTWGMFHMKEHNYGGPFCDLGVHLIDCLFWIMGDAKVESVSGCTYKKIAGKGEDVLISIAESGAYTGVFTPRPYDYREFTVEEFSNGFLRLQNGKSVNFKFSWAINLPTTNLDMVICGDKGGLNVGKEILYKNVGNYQAETTLKWFDNGEYKGVPFEQHRYMYRHIMDVLDGKGEYLITKEENLEVTKAIECFYRSAELGREVRADELSAAE